VSSPAPRDGKEVAALRKELGASNLLAEAEIICGAHRVSLDVVLSGIRSRAASKARHAIFAAIRKHGLSYPEIARLFGMDHTSVREAILRWETPRARPKV
jgi:chromosomal replication initiation ATPase DnaA